MMSKNHDRGAQSHAEYRAIRVFPGLDALRGLSIVAVVWHHQGSPIPGLMMAQRGFLGVDVFFVLSGFLIVTLLLRERDRHGQISLRAFYVRRSLRIFPLYYALLAVLTVVCLVRPGFGARGLGGSFLSDLPYLATYTSNWIKVIGGLSVAWSLATEEQFYLVWPAIERWLGRGRWVVWAIAIIACQLAALGTFDPWLPAGHGSADLEILQATFTPILFGVALAHLLHHRASYDRVAAWLGPRRVRWGIAIVGVFVLNLDVDLTAPMRLGLHVLAAVGLAAWLVNTRKPRTRMSWPHRAIARLGQVSYGVYLLHLMVSHVVLTVFLPQLPGPIFGAQFVLCLALSWLIAELSFRGFEQPFLRLKRRFAR